MAHRTAGLGLDGDHPAIARVLAGIRRAYGTLKKPEIRTGGGAWRVRRARGSRPVAFILSANLARRHMTVGPIAEADLVIEFAPEMVDEVMANRTALDKAYSDALRCSEKGTMVPFGRRTGGRSTHAKACLPGCEGMSAGR